MNFQTNLLIFSDLKTIIFTLLIVYLIYQLYKLYRQLWTLPPGPFPLPIIGNILLFRGKDNPVEVVKAIKDKYGPVFTIWLGSEPIVFISDLDIGRDVFSKIEFSSRPQCYIVNQFCNDKHKDCVFTSGETWNVLRKITHNAIQKYATNEKLSLLVNDCVGHTVNDIIAREGVDREFSSYQYIDSLVTKIITISVFGESNCAGDDILNFIDMVLNSSKSVRIIVWVFSSFIRLLDWRAVNEFNKLIDNSINSSKTIFQNHYKDYDESIERDFCDALITAKKEALKESKKSLKYLTDENLTMLIWDLFVTSKSTSVDTLQWLILLMTYYPELQQKIRQEIENEIGDRIATHEDRYRCHYLMAFISESLRLKNAVPFGGPHSSIVPAKIGNYCIPEGNVVIVYQDMILTDEKYWTNAQQFIPQRFLENGEYMKVLPKAYIPFGVGRRVCPGEKLAYTNLFLVIVNFLQMTKEYELILGSNGGLGPHPNTGVTRPPCEFKISLKKKII